MELLDPSIDARHRSYLHATNGAIAVPVLRMRVPKKAWRLHPDWIPRYVHHKVNIRNLSVFEIPKRVN